MGESLFAEGNVVAGEQRERWQGCIVLDSSLRFDEGIENIGPGFPDFAGTQTERNVMGPVFQIEGPFDMIPRFLGGSLVNSALGGRHW